MGLIAADEADAFFEAEGGGGGANGTGPPTLTAEERATLTAELKKTEDEINTLRQVLQARMKHSSELKRKLGLTPWTEAMQDFSTGLKTVRESPAYQKTAAAAATGAEAVTNKLQGIRNSTAFKSFGESVGNAYGAVKAKIAASTSMQSFTGGASGATSPTAEEAKAPLS